MPLLSRPPTARPAMATGALLSVALLLACAVAYQAHRAARAHRAAAERLLRDNTAYAAAEFGRRAAATLESGLVTVQHFPTGALEGRPAATPLPSASAFREAVRVSDFWCQCFDATRGFFRLSLEDDSLDVADAVLDGPTGEWIRDRVAAHVARLARAPGEQSMSLLARAEGRATRTEYQLRIKQTTGLLRSHAGRAQALIFTVVYDAGGRPRAAYGVAGDAASFAVPVFQRVMARAPLFPASVMPGVPNDSALRVTVRGPGGGALFRSAAAGAAAVVVEEPVPGAFAGLVVRAELTPAAAAVLLEGGMPDSPLPLLLGLLAVIAGVIGVAFVQFRRQHELARLRADFVAGVSHELRTPLTQIRMCGELLLGGRLRSDEEREWSLRLIDREARRLAYLVENLLDFSRAGRSAPVLSPAPVRVAPAVEEVVRGFAPLARARGMRLRAELDPECVAALDPGAFRQVLLNLLENAVKYGPSGQTITVRAERAGGTVRVQVEDGGPGVPAGERRRVWEPYHRLDREVDRVVGGCGIGLSVVRDLVARHGGRVRVEDAPAGGARFVAEFAAAALAGGEAGAPDAAAAVQEAAR